MSFQAVNSVHPITRAPGIGALVAAHPVAAAMLAFLVVMSPALFKHPAETGDTVEYLRAARCVAERWFCAPHDHWSARWPVFTPTGWLMRVWGESRLTIGLLPLLHGIASVALFAAILQRTLGKRVALIGGLMFAATPLVSELSMQLGADIAELSFLLAGVFALSCSEQGRRAGPLLLAGVLFALAVETRLTSAVTGLLIATALIAWRWPPRAFLVIGAGGALVLIASMVAHWIGTGDPLTLYRMSLDHSRVPTTELPRWVDTSGSPFFNLDLIRNWNRSVSVHWTVDPVLNLLASPKVGPSLGAALLILLLGRSALSGGSRDARALRALGVGSVAFLLISAFALSIHPTPRMFLPLLAAAVAIIAILVGGARRDLRPVVLFGLLPLLLLQSFTLRALTYDPVEVEQLAESWVRAEREPIATDQRTSRHLELAPAVRALPVDRPAVPLRLLLVRGSCDAFPDRLPSWTVRRTVPLDRSSGLREILQDFGLGAKPEQWSLCLYRT